jgi:hypothetical protein
MHTTSSSARSNTNTRGARPARDPSPDTSIKFQHPSTKTKFHRKLFISNFYNPNRKETHKTQIGLLKVSGIAASTFGPGHLRSTFHRVGSIRPNLWSHPRPAPYLTLTHIPTMGKPYRPPLRLLILFHPFLTFSQKIIFQKRRIAGF